MSDKPVTAARRKAQGRKNRDLSGKEATPAADGAKSEDNPPDGIKALALDYPFALIAGGVVFGVLIGALLPRRHTSRLSRPLLAAAGAASEFGLAYAHKALNRAATAAHDVSASSGRLLEAAGDRTDDLVDGVADQALDLATKARSMAGAAPGAIRVSGRRLAREVVRLTSQLRH